MAIAICGSTALKDLGDSVIVTSKRCSVETYLTFGPSTQCYYCQGYGYPTVKRPVQKDNSPPTYAVCAERHATELHACTFGNCKQGILCTYPPIKCINCDSPHKASGMPNQNQNPDRPQSKMANH
jgi:hypothetical protein